MLVYNLSDKTKPGCAPRAPKALIIDAQKVEPGRFVEVSDSLPRGDIAALLQDELISIGHLPQWYQEALRAPEEPPVVTPKRRGKKES